ncbi:hypothetical protein TorRG33x02_215850, partial [Trema orientale]
VPRQFQSRDLGALYVGSLESEFVEIFLSTFRVLGLFLGSSSPAALEEERVSASWNWRPILSGRLAANYRFCLLSMESMKACA